MRLQYYFSFRRLTFVGILSLGLALLAGCSLSKVPAQASEQKTSQQEQIKMVKVMEINKQKIGDPLELGAEVESSAQLQVNTVVSGAVEQIFKKRGDIVKQGEVILRINSKGLDQQKEVGVIALQNAQAKLDRTKKENNLSIFKMNENLAAMTRALNKMKNDYDQGLITKEELDDKNKQLSNARVELNVTKEQQVLSVNELRQQVNDAQKLLQKNIQAFDYMDVKAPANGVLSLMPIEMGMTLQAGAQVGIVEKLDTVKIRADLSLEAANIVRGKKELTYYTTDQSQQLKGKVSYLAPLIDPVTKAYELNLELPNADMSLQPGMKVRVQLTNEEEQVVVAVPTRAIFQEGDVTYVYVVNGDQVEKRKIVLGRLNEPLQEVLSGVKEKELLVISGQNQLKNNEKVQWTLVQGQYE
jgi:HlyD family secretion protein